MEGDYEAQRLDAQDRVDSSKTKAERNRLGQFATPTELADEILTSTRRLLDGGDVRFLDPGFGTGSFYSALLRVFGEDAVDTALGVEIDPDYADEAAELWKTTSLNVLEEDFTDLDPPFDDGQRYNLVVCNPPYVRHHHIEPEKKKQLQELVENRKGLKISGLAGLYCYFMLLSHDWMTDDGLAAWLIPSEWMDVNYGSILRTFLTDKVSLVRIHRFNPEEVQFQDALVSSVVVFFRAREPSENHQVKFTYGGSLLEPTKSREVPLRTLVDSAKWTRFTSERQSTKQRDKTATLDALFTINRGIATGANDFFILSEAEAETHEIPNQFLTPILPPPRKLDESVIEGDDQGVPRIEEPMFLLSCSLPKYRLAEEYPALLEYIEAGEEEEFDQRYLCRNRDPWYSQPERDPSPIVCTYMGRQTDDRTHPFRFIRNDSHAIATNSYLMLYPRSSLSSLASSTTDGYEQICEALNETPIRIITDEGRVYGGGLHKVEPSELSNVAIDYLLEAIESGFASAIEEKVIGPETIQMRLDSG